MTHMLRKHQNGQKTSSSSSSSTPLLLHRDSRVIGKVQPKIRIIHIFAPEIIQTDVANFRELVQRLTGKPAPSSTAATTTSTSSGSSSLERNTSANSDNYKAVMEPIYDSNVNYYNNSFNNAGFIDGEDRVHGGFLEGLDGENEYLMDMGDFSNLQPHHQHHFYEDTFLPLPYRG